MPILYQNHFIGRIEFEKYSPNKSLTIKQCWWKENIIKTPKMIDAFNLASQNFAAYLDVNVITPMQ